MRRGLFALAVVSAAMACGYSGITTPPHVEHDEILQPPIVTITPTGLDPKILHQTTGRDVTFVNADTKPHTLYGDAHPAHHDYKECAVVDELGELPPGARRRIDVFPLGLCGFHDEAEPQNPAFQGYVVVH